jgi:hypothetical protein
VAEGEKSLDRLIQLIHTITGTLLTERKIRDIMTSLLASPDRGLHLELATMVDRRGTSAENA